MCSLDWCNDAPGILDTCDHIGQQEGARFMLSKEEHQVMLSNPSMMDLIMWLSHHSTVLARCIEDSHIYRLCERRVHIDDVLT
jgi:hypothetical protein